MNHKGNLNPYFNKRHSEIEKEKISKTQKLRYSKLRELAKKLEEHALNERITLILKEQLSHYTHQTSTPI